MERRHSGGDSQPELRPGTEPDMLGNRFLNHKLQRGEARVALRERREQARRTLGKPRDLRAIGCAREGNARAHALDGQAQAPELPPERAADIEEAEMKTRGCKHLDACAGGLRWARRLRGHRVTIN